MDSVLTDFEWFRDPSGYRLSVEEIPGQECSSPGSRAEWIVPKSDSTVGYRPFARGAEIYAAFSSIETPADLLKFVNLHGYLTWGAINPYPHLTDDATYQKFPRGEPISLGLAEAKMFREILDLRDRREMTRLASHFKSKIHGFVDGGQAGRVELLPDPKIGIRMRITPPTLLGALWYQLALHLNDATLRRCRHCNKYFRAGAGTNLRADAIFCCREHKNAHHNNHRSQKAVRSKKAT
jgi:hypothetical protein